MNQAALQQYKAIGVQGGIMDANLFSKVFRDVFFTKRPYF